MPGRRIVGGAVVIAKDGKGLLRCGYGHLTSSGTAEFTPETQLRIASVTKMVTAIGLMQLLEEKGLSLETPVKDIVGFPVVNPAFKDTPLTVRQVMSHTSSFLSISQYRPNWEHLLHENKYFDEYHAPGTRYEYSNMNGGLVGAMIEALSGQSLNTYMQEKVFAPLGIEAAYHAALLPDPSRLAPRLNRDGSIYRTVSKEIGSFAAEYSDTCDPRNNIGNSVGGLNITADGLCRILCLLEQGGELDGVRILSEAGVAMMIADQRTVKDSSVYCKSPYGLCVYRATDVTKNTWYGHQGMLYGVTCDAFFQPETGLCVAILANGYDSINQNGIVTLARVIMEKAEEIFQ